MAGIALNTATRNSDLAFETLFSHYIPPTWCIYGNKDGTKVIKMDLDCMSVIR